MVWFEKQEEAIDSVILDKVKTSSKNMTFYNDGYHRFVIQTSADKPIVGSLASWKEIAEFSKILLEHYNSSLGKIPYRLTGLTTIKSVFDYYQAQGRGVRKKIKKTITKGLAFRKAEANRSAIESTPKKLDNLRYAIARAYNLASSNQIPVGVWQDSFMTDTILFLLDRGNLYEFLHGSEDKDEFWAYSKKNIMSVLSEFIDEYGDKCPSDIIQMYQKYSEEKPTIKLYVREIIGEEAWKSILNEIVPFNFLIADENVCINEMKNFNGKSFPWQGPVFLIQYLMTLNKLDVNGTLEYFADTMKDQNQSYAEYIIDNISADDCIETGFAYATFYPMTKSVPFQFDPNDKTNDLLFLKDMFELANPTKIKDKKNIDKFYKKYCTREVNLMGTGIKYNVANPKLYKGFADDWKAFGLFLAKFWEHNLFTSLEKKGKLLETAWDKERERLSAEAKVNQTTALLPEHQKNKLLMPGQCASATDFKVALLFGVYKVLKQKQKNEDTFIDTILNTMYEYMYGDSVVRVKKEKGEVVSYEVISDEWQDWLNDSPPVGYNSKSNWIYIALCKLNENLESILGGKPDTNESKKLREMDFIMEDILKNKFTEAIWYAEAPDGSVSEIGVRNGIWTTKTSWEHTYDGVSERWEDGYFEEVDINSGRGKSAKPLTKLAGYKVALDEQKRLLDRGKIDSEQFEDSTLVLNKIVNWNGWDNIVYYLTWNENKK
jgi:hypothetical protein